MSGDWIKMQGSLWTSPEVVRIMSATKADKCRVIGGLFRAWCLFDEHTSDGYLDGYTCFLLDDELRIEGFSQAMIDIGWIKDVSGNGLQVVDFDAHMSKSAKKRAQDSRRKKVFRKMSENETDKNTTREEKRREEKRRDNKNTTPSGEDNSNLEKFNFKKSFLDLGVDELVLSDWLKVRSKGRAANTETAFKGLKNKIEKSGLTANQAITICAEKSWKGFDGSWVEGNSSESRRKSEIQKFVDMNRNRSVVSEQ